MMAVRMVLFLLAQKGAMGKNKCMRKKKQLEFEGFKRSNVEFGGSLLKGNPKIKRPLESKLPILLTLRAVQSGMRLPKSFGLVSAAVDRCSKKYGVKVYEFANVGNHLHLVIKIPRRQSWAGFIRELTGEIAAAMKQILNIQKKFWMFRPHTRVIQGWKKAFQIARQYVQLNTLEAEGKTNRREISNLKQMREIMTT